MENEKRQVLRRDITLAVRMATGLGPPLKCNLKDISETGARIEVHDPGSSPQEFLVILNGDLKRWCRVMWRSKNEIGIKFIKPPKCLIGDKAKAASD
jgi:PilZ domain